MSSRLLLRPGVTLLAVESLQEAMDVAKRRGVTTSEGLEAIGERLARIRKERGLTQKELADRLGISQPIVSDYERGELRLHGELLVELARILEVSVDEILGLEPTKQGGAVKNRRLLRRLQQIDLLPKRDQQALLRTLDAFLAKVDRGGRSSGGQRPGLVD
jgi:transcriptional regulator with XRE-family HTH domain